MYVMPITVWSVGLRGWSNILEGEGEGGVVWFNTSYM